ncbi:ABC transporter substrate-binding protein [Neobacillus sp. 179-C4.2 HS]|uniref:ABC transporter substrate-binding protein n=1 Tax=Neobacillus driksii TaxID=3035913 RepID=A0ABV4YTA9_9BACI|nr:ABC transporter substrate-binding protein [Neobacillus sp. 179.-C4.2 HS]MDP5195116.1 ABC transporter substrate-binding protein [Neobacillus sp. 179.-C4.2 HS]
MNKKFKGLYIGLSLLVCFLLIITGCSSNKSVDNSNTNGTSKESGEKVLKIALNADATRLDPHFNSTASDLTVTQPIFNGLVRFKPGTVSGSEIEGDLAESWESNPEGTIWTFKLREGVHWHNGYGEFTSEDVKWTFERILDPTVGSRFHSELAVIEKVEAPDKYTAVIYLKQPDAAFLQRILMDGSAGAIVKKEAIEEAGEKSMTQPIGTGPFMMEEYKQGQGITLKKNPEYFRGEPKIDKIEYITMSDRNAVDVALEKGEIQMAVGETDQLWLQQAKGKQNWEVEFVDQEVYWGLFLNTTIKPLDDSKVRKAIAHAIDVEKYAKEVYGGGETGHTAGGPIGSSLFGAADLGIYEYDPELSKKLLAEAGYPDGLTLPKQFLSSRPNYVQMMTFIQEELRKVKIEMPLEKVDVATYGANIRQNLNGLVLYGRATKPHAAFALDDHYYGPSIVGKKTGKLNFSHYDKSDALIEQAAKEIDEKKAESLYQQIQQEIYDEYVVVPMTETKNVLVRNKNVDLGYQIKGTLNYFYTINENTDIK